MLDNNALNYVLSTQLIHKTNNPNHGVALKCSSLCSIADLRVANTAQLRIRSAFSSGFGNLSETLNAKQVKTLLRLNQNFPIDIRIFKRKECQFYFRGI